MEQPPGAVVLLSGGLDSATCLAVAASEGFRPLALSVDYGQRHRHELSCARALADRAGVEHVVLGVDLATVGGSALTADLEVPKHATVEDLEPGVPVTYVPARNTVLLALALSLAEARGICDLYVGVNAVDSSGYPDCRPAFVAAFEALANVATTASTEHGARIRVHAPLLELTKAEIVRLGVELGVDHTLTTSCYDPRPTGAACGRCDACLLRRAGFAAAGVTDPIRYEP